MNYRELADIKIPKAEAKTYRYPKEKLWDIRIIDRKVENGKNLVLVHYIGFERRYDEWQQEDMVLSVPPEVKEKSAYGHFKHQLLIEIKGRLCVTRGVDSKVDINVPIQSEIFKEVSKLGIPVGQKFRIRSADALTNLLCPRWNLRICNQYGDFAEVVLETLRFWLGCRKPLLEFTPDTPTVGDGTSFLRNEVHRGFVFRMTFVRHLGNKKDLAMRK